MITATEKQTENTINFYEPEKLERVTYRFNLRFVINAFQVRIFSDQRILDDFYKQR